MGCKTSARRKLDCQPTVSASLLTGDGETEGTHGKQGRGKPEGTRAILKKPFQRSSLSLAACVRGERAASCHMQPRALPRLASLGLWSQAAAPETFQKGSWAILQRAPVHFMGISRAYSTRNPWLRGLCPKPTGFETSVCWDPCLWKTACRHLALGRRNLFQPGSQTPRPAQRHRAAARRTEVGAHRRPEAKLGRKTRAFDGSSGPTPAIWEVSARWV